MGQYELGFDHGIQRGVHVFQIVLRENVLAEREGPEERGPGEATAAVARVSGGGRVV